MRAVDLDLRELLEFEPQGGIIRFGGRRALLMDADALGLLRKEIVETVGVVAARGILARFGFAHGWLTASNMKTAFPWDTELEWRRAGGRIHTLQGQVVFENIERAPGTAAPGTAAVGTAAPGTAAAGTGTGMGAPFAEAIWRESYEADQHLATLGQSDEPVCWALVGFASGYMSFVSGGPIVCIETRCRGKGDAICKAEARPRAEWSQEILQKHAPFEKECCDSVLTKLTAELKQTERKLSKRRAELSRVAGVDADPAGMVSRSAPMQKVIDLLNRVAKVDATVLLIGESGVGKERLARMVHEASARASGPFVAINCAAVPETLLESELFGHSKGSFTGATQDRAGLFEAASGGTLLLDEVGDIPLTMQAKLLRVLQEREVRRVGENKNRAVDVRVIAATNRDLAGDTAKGAFRQDLYYRLRVVEVRVPPLRERKDDVLAMARLFVAEASKRMGRKITGLSPHAANRLLAHEWPGNVRELENAIERAVALAQGTRIEPGDLPDEIAKAGAGANGGDRQNRSSSSGSTLADVEREHILATLEELNGNRTETAARLAIGIATLHRKLKEYRKQSATVGGAPEGPSVTER